MIRSGIADYCLAWLRLVRLPNLLAVPGDVMAGFLLSGGTWWNQGIAASLAVSLCIYTAGLISNDYFDIDEDRRDRPQRPLASGAAGRPPAFAAFVILFSIALSLALMSGSESLQVIAVLLVSLSLSYNTVGKHLGMGGPVILGVCRGLNVMLGWSAAGAGSADHVLVLVAVLSVMFYMMAVSFAAKKETLGCVSAPLIWLPEAVLAISLSMILAFRFSFVTAALGWFAVTYGALFIVSGVNAKDDANIPSVIGGFIRQLILLQAIFCSSAAPEGLPIAAALCAAWLAFPLAARVSYSS